MRTIKFRGKTEDGIWVFGSFVDTMYEDKALIVGRALQTVVYDVNKETVGQFTSLTDKNGKEIYEGDVIKCGLMLYVCEFIEGGFEFRDLSDGNLVLKAIVNNSCIIGNIHDNPDLLK